MQRVFEKIIEKLEVKEVQAYAKTDGGANYKAYRNAIKIVKQEAAEYNNGWISCSERLPENPDAAARGYGLPLPEYIVMIYGGYAPTTLEYVGDGEWHDPLTNAEYKVTAWQPLPAPYQPKGE